MMVYSWSMFLLVFILFMGCHQKENSKIFSEKSSTSFLSEQQQHRLQSYCEHIADSADGGILIADLHSNEVIVLVNRKYMVESRHHPASTFKIVTGITSILFNVTQPADFSCTGFFIIHGDTTHCWDRAGHGKQALEQAIQNSCNCYFASLTSRCSGEKIRSIADRIGYGKKTFFNVSGERVGVLASAIPEQDKVQFGLGHSRYCSVTGVQLLQLMCILATRGECIHTPKMFDWDKLSPIYRGMEQAVLRGTAEPARAAGYPAAGKTGTLIGDVNWETRGWFCGFAPYDAPEVAVVTFCQSGTGRNNASPLAGLVFKKISELRGQP